ncbi:C-terminal processing peptidase [Xenococcus sp. PCC 7305]|uniref:carboxyl-terminal processing protease CtpB n=1 Tax=Xenococcus sp. PCC 7305 TaxID=102125 RepID=UPI0002AD0EA1|nr:carboxyl-terminal processing protease CtpB [Xenococcus sp. PCC 7305]ELS02970.1 C-terminal processing peptidase [Xenococcus sp. PCC 7305]
MTTTSRRLMLRPVKTLKYLGTAIATTTLLISSTGSAVKATLEDSPKTIVDEVWQIVHNEFVDREFNEIDWLEKRQELLEGNYANQEQAYRAIRESLKELGDPYTRFLDPKKFEELTSQTSGELSGIGIRLTIEEETSQITVVEPLADSPADEAGIKPGDKIVSINGKPTSLMSLEQASEEIRGEVGTDVSLKIARSGNSTFDVTLTRSQIELPSVNYSISKEGQTNVGYIRLDEFSSHAAEQMQEAIEDLSQENVSGFVLDLRGNPGGLLFSSVEIARMWLEEGAIVSTKDSKGGDQKFFANGKALTDLPLVILVDRYSASASEILAGALKENNRATIVGTRTYGKGTVQSVHSLSDGSGLAVTIAQYYPPSGMDINFKGIAPDIEVDLTSEQQLAFNVNPALFATPADPQFAKAIQILKNISASQVGQPSNSITIR